MLCGGRCSAFPRRCNTGPARHAFPPVTCAYSRPQPTTHPHLPAAPAGPAPQGPFDHASLRARRRGAADVLLPDAGRPGPQRAVRGGHPAVHRVLRGDPRAAAAHRGPRVRAGHPHHLLPAARRRPRDGGRRQQTYDGRRQAARLDPRRAAAVLRGRARAVLVRHRYVLPEPAAPPPPLSPTPPPSVARRPSPPRARSPTPPPSQRTAPSRRPTRPGAARGARAG